MSLATTGGGLGGGAGGAGGLVMAHQANAMARPAAQPPPQATVPPGSAPPPSSSAAALGADLVDKQQSLSLKQVRNLSHLPMVAVDLFASDPIVAKFPPKSKDPVLMATVSPSLVGKMKGDIYLKPSEATHKIFRKYLGQLKPYTALQTGEVLAKSDDSDAVKIERPQQWLGLRRVKDAPEFIRKGTAGVKETSDSKEHAIEEEASQDVGVTIVDGTLDGSVPQGDDFDRVICKVRLHSSKKALTVMPEEAVALMMHQAQHHVAAKVKASPEDEEIDDYPCALAVPAWACHDAAMEALLDATNGKGVIFQRSMGALAGALRPSADGKPNSLLEQINKYRTLVEQEFQRQKAKDPDAICPDDTLLVLFGLAHDGFECTAVHVSSLQPDNQNCIFGNFKVLCNFSTQDEDPESLIEEGIQEIYSAVKTIAPESDAPAALITYGSLKQQGTIKEHWSKVAADCEDWKALPLVSTKAECVALGTAILGAVAHGRLQTVMQIAGKKPKAGLGIRIQNVAPVAVGISMNYHGGAANKWTEIKTIFDFDRRVPAGPYPVELKASESVLYRSDTKMSDEEFLKASTAKEASKFIPEREEAALDLRVQLYQKWNREGEWKKVGDQKKPLVKTESSDDEKDKEIEVACESVVLELSLGATGIITASLVGDRQSVVQATKSARNSAIRYYIGILFAIAFFGGFLIKSYWEERVFERDTKRLLMYYKHALPGSIQDGDVHNARYLVWKYKGKSEKLWRSLEKKYGIPVRQAHEWPEEEEQEGEEETEDGNEEEQGDDSENAKEESEPDL